MKKTKDSDSQQQSTTTSTSSSGPFSKFKSLKKVGKSISSSLSNAAALVSAPIFNRIESVEFIDEQTTKFIWIVSGISTYNLGEKVSSTAVAAGGTKWVLDLFPQGFAVPNCMSLYLNVANLHEITDRWQSNVNFSFAVLDPVNGQYRHACTFSKIFNKEMHSWGKNNFLALKDMEKADFYVNDAILIGCTVTCMSQVEHTVDYWGVTSQGKHRTVWKVSKFDQVCARFKAGQKLSSMEFSVAGMPVSWTIDLYPNGFKTSEYVAVYLHAGQSLPARGVRVPFIFLMFDVDNREFVPFANMCQTFQPSARCWGKHNLIHKSELEDEESPFIDKEGNLIIAVDIATMKDNSAQVRRYLFVPLSSATRCKNCYKTFYLNGQKWTCHYCGEVFCGNCCSNKFPVPYLGQADNYPVCDKCVTEIHNLSKLKQLKYDADNFVGITAERKLRSGTAEMAVQVEGGLWVPDLSQISCSRLGCPVEFGWWQRKHHCRSCGKLFCGSCTSWKGCVPEFGYWEEVRLCQQCFSERKDMTFDIVHVSRDLRNRLAEPKLKARPKVSQEEEEQAAMLQNMSEAELSKARRMCPNVFARMDSAKAKLAKKKKKKADDTNSNHNGDNDYDDGNGDERVSIDSSRKSKSARSRTSSSRSRSRGKSKDRKSAVSFAMDMMEDDRSSQQHQYHHNNNNGNGNNNNEKQSAQHHRGTVGRATAAMKAAYSAFTAPTDDDQDEDSA